MHMICKILCNHQQMADLHHIGSTICTRSSNSYISILIWASDTSKVSPWRASKASVIASRASTSRPCSSQYRNWLVIRPKHTTSVGWKKEERQQSPQKWETSGDKRKGPDILTFGKHALYALLGCAFHVPICWKLQEFHNSVCSYVETCGETTTLQQNLLHLSHTCTHKRSHRNSSGFQAFHPCFMI